MERTDSGDDGVIALAFTNGLEVHFFGVRGSRPVSGATYLTYGGNTACVGVCAGEKWILFDAGSGIANASGHVAAGGPVEIFLSHLHHDHLMGLMFFQPVHQRPGEISVYTYASMLPALKAYWSSPYFPARNAEGFPKLQMCPLGQTSRLAWRRDRWEASQEPDASEEKGLRLESLYLPPAAHPCEGVVAYKVVYCGKAIVYATDVELARGDVARRLVDFAQGAQLLICDAHFSDDEYEAYTGWGHSSIGMAVEVAKQARVERLALFHHAPHRDDAAMARLETEARRSFSGAFAAREGMRLNC